MFLRRKLTTLNGATTCKKCGSPLYQRDDDNPETVGKRLDTYFKETQPLVDYYKKQGKLFTVKSGKQPPSEVFAVIAAELEKRVGK